MNRSVLNKHSILPWVDLTCSFAAISEVSVEHSQKQIWGINWQIHKFKYRVRNDEWFYCHFDIRLHNGGSVVLLNHCFSRKNFVSRKIFSIPFLNWAVRPLDSLFALKASKPQCPYLMLRIHPLALSESLVISDQDHFKNFHMTNLISTAINPLSSLEPHLNCFSTQYWPCSEYRSYTVRTPQNWQRDGIIVRTNWFYMWFVDLFYFGHGVCF